MKRSEYREFHNLRTEQDWIDHFRNNLHNGGGLVAMWSCPKCDEIIFGKLENHHC